jgi:hypothetical protein
MNVEIWTEAAQFPEKEYTNGIFLAVLHLISCLLYCRKVTGFNYDNSKFYHILSFIVAEEGTICRLNNCQTR